MTFWYLVRVVKSRILIILGLVVLTPAVIYVAAPKPKIMYPASVLVSPTAQVMQAGVSTTNAPERESNMPDRNVVLSNLIILAQGGDVYERAREFLELPIDEQKKLCKLPMYKSVRRIDIEVQQGKPLSISDWPEVLEVVPIQNMALGGEQGTTTDIIKITIKMMDGSITPYLANAVAYAFSEAYQDKSREDIRRYIKFLESSRETSRKRLATLQNAIVVYKNTHRVLNVDSETQNAISSLSKLQADKGEAEAAVRESSAAVADINAQLSHEPAVIYQQMPGELNPSVLKLRTDLLNAEAELRDIADHAKPAHPEYKAAQAKIAALQDAIGRESKGHESASVNEVRKDLIRKRSETEYNLASAKARLASVTASLAESQTKADNLASAEPGLVELMREYGQQENSFKMVSEKLAQSEVAEEEFTKTGSIIILDGARGLDKQQVMGPTKKMLMLYGLVLALIVGIAGSVWFDSIDNRLRNASDVEKLLELPTIGATPQVVGGNGDLTKLTHIYPLSAMAESYRILRTNVLFALRDTPFKTLMVATGRPGEGATTTICNLAIALAQIGKRVILIDADMRRPSLHKFFGVSNDTGLSTVLNSSCKLTDAFRKTDIENLIIIPGGPLPTNPSELLGSDRMREIVDMLQAHCDLVLFDTPSTIVFSDGPMLASWIDAVIMVLSANRVSRGTEIVARDLLRRANANIIGVVVNRMPQDRVDSCYYYSHYDSDSMTPDGIARKLSDEPQGVKAIPAGTVESSESEEENKPFPD